MSKFKVGDIIRVKKDVELPYQYTVTNEKMAKAEVVKSVPFGHYDIEIKVIEHADKKYVHSNCYVESKYFEIFKEDKIEEKIMKESNIKIIKENGKTFLIINNKFTVCIEGKYGISSLNDETDAFNEEIGKALAYYRLMK